MHVERAKLARADINAIWFGLAAAISIATLGFDLIYQRVFDRQPCPWCDLEQASLLLAGLCTAVGFAVRRRPVSAGVLAGLALSLAAFGSAASFAQLDAEKSASCDLATANNIIGALRLDRVLPGLIQVRAKCDAAKGLLDPRFWKWSAAAFAGVGALMLLVLRNVRLPV
jgi:protein dithiol:quinone oxidoreductase